VSPVRNQLVVLLKAPRTGSVKTRLAEGIGPEAACAVYQQLVATLLANLAPLPSVELCFTPADASAEVVPWLRAGWSSQPQVAGDLGARLHAVFLRHFQAGACRVVVIGADSPEVMPADVATAWQALADHDVVLGPAVDGGYWLVGLCAPQEQLFTAMPWSTDAVLAETQRRARASGLRVALLRELSDVDTVADWERWRHRSGKLLRLA